MIDLTRERELLRQRALGWSPACPLIDEDDLGRDLTLAAGPNGRDLVRVTGVDNLGQALSIALTTRLGDDVFNTQFGFDGINAIAEETDSVLMRERIRVAVIQVLRKEPRIRRIVDVKLGDERLERPASSSRELNVRVLCETVAGDQTSIDLSALTPGNALQIGKVGI
jgi:phage baseplate assembly protein W